MKHSFNKPRSMRNGQKRLGVSPPVKPIEKHTEPETAYQVEPELRTSVRQAVWTSEARGTRKLILGLLLATVLIGGFKAYFDLRELYALLQQGQVTTAQVIDKYETHSKGTSYWLKYRFYGGGEWINDIDDVSQSLYASTTQGDTLRVTYLPSDPSIHRRKNVDRLRVMTHGRNWIVGIGLVAGLFVLMKVGLEYGYLQQMRLAVSGVPVVGKIVTCEPPSDSKSHLYTVTYTFVDMRGNTRTAVWNAPEAQAEQLQAGENITALCDPKREGNCRLYRALDAVQIRDA